MSGAPPCGYCSSMSGVPEDPIGGGSSMVALDIVSLTVATILNLLLSRTSTDEMGSKVEWEASVTWNLNINEM